MAQFQVPTFSNQGTEQQETVPCLKVREDEDLLLVAGNGSIILYQIYWGSRTEGEGQGGSGHEDLFVWVPLAIQPLVYVLISVDFMNESVFMA